MTWPPFDASQAGPSVTEGGAAWQQPVEQQAGTGTTSLGAPAHEPPLPPQASDMDSMDSMSLGGSFGGVGTPDRPQLRRTPNARPRRGKGSSSHAAADAKPAVARADAHTADAARSSAISLSRLALRRSAPSAGTAAPSKTAAAALATSTAAAGIDTLHLETLGEVIIHPPPLPSSLSIIKATAASAAGPAHGIAAAAAVDVRADKALERSRARAAEAKARLTGTPPPPPVRELGRGSDATPSWLRGVGASVRLRVLSSNLPIVE